MPAASAALNPGDHYEITAAGRHHLKDQPTDLLARELQALVLLTRPLPLRALQTLIPGCDADAAADIAARLLSQGLIEPSPDAATASATGFFGASGVWLPGTSPGDLEAIEERKLQLDLERPGFHVNIARRSVRRVEPAGDDQYNLLVIEDDPFLARAYNRLLSLLGFRTHYAATHAEIAAAFAQRERPDLVLLDLNLPNVDGFEVLRGLSEHDRLHHVPVVVASGDTTKRTILRALAADASGYITKPIAINGLVDTLRAVLGLPTIDRHSEDGPDA